MAAGPDPHPKEEPVSVTDPWSVPDHLAAQVGEILGRVEDASGFDVEDLVGPSRARPLVAWRFRAIWAARTAIPDLSFPALAALFGGRDHTTILAAYRKVEKDPVERRHAARLIEDPLHGERPALALVPALEPAHLVWGAG